MADQPWEQTVGLPNVIYDKEDGVFRMWYAVYDSFAWEGSKHGSRASRDGNDIPT